MRCGSMVGMKTLAEKFNRNGFEFEQVQRTENAAIYQKFKSGGACSFEVIRIRERKEREAFGTTFEAGEFYPSSEEWGVFGWTYVDLVGAQHRLGVLTASKSKNGTTPLK